MKRKTYYLNEDQKEQMPRKLSALLREREKIAFAYLFGSFIEGRPIHDVDIGVYLSDVRGVSSLQYSLDLSNFLSTALHMPVEVTVLNGAPSAFLFHVIKGRLILERDEALRVRVVENTVRRYLDQKPLLLRGIREAFAA
jgi:uncharacterized protein